MLRFYGPVNPMGSCQARSVYLTTRLLGRLSSKRLTNIVPILPPETDNCPSCISGRERMTVENISRSISMKECCRPRRGSNPQPPGLQSDAHPTEPPRPANFLLDQSFKAHAWPFSQATSIFLSGVSSWPTAYAEQQYT